MTSRFPTLELDPIEPGRGAWKQVGGLLPLTPTTKSKTGYYRRSIATEVMIGRAGVSLTGGTSGLMARPTFHERMVWYGVREFQRRLGLSDDGLFGDQTSARVLTFQKGAGLDADGILGPATALEIFRPLVIALARLHGVPAQMLGGSAIWESGLDPAAVGVNGLDLGLVQINSGAHAVSMAQATNAEYALNFAASDMAEVMDKWRGKTKVDPGIIAIANHNNPSLARTWALTGVAPFSQSRADNGFPQIDEYVNSVLNAGRVFR